ncbi:hypothetical protein CLIM01_15182 [Colletotrichum limetticola]|uniref:Chromo domain-containing protein n=1 Tax=Colletotrichum limetticola TaxID=1209924 RepID=A0ABQ9P6H8_9PEZI|nr:hypothetical protein CLIM01_15182 [Colletotrichum limetticola]
MRATSVDQIREDGSSTTEWQVRRIQGHSQSGDAIYYHVAWQPTWECRDRLQHMLPDLVSWDSLHGCVSSRRPPSRRYDPTLEHWSGEVAGRKEVDGLVYYKIEWQVTTEPAKNLENALSLVKEYWDNVRSLKSGNRRGQEEDSDEI